MSLTIDGRCTACGLCLATCPEHALRAAPRRPELITEACTLCLECVEICPVDAIAPHAITPYPITPGRTPSRPS